MSKPNGQPEQQDRMIPVVTWRSPLEETAPSREAAQPGKPENVVPFPAPRTETGVAETEHTVAEWLFRSAEGRTLGRLVMVSSGFGNPARSQNRPSMSLAA